MRTSEEIELMECKKEFKARELNKKIFEMPQFLERKSAPPISST